MFSIGTKFSLIEDHCSDVPYMDPWGAEALVTILPFLDGNLKFWDNFWSSHNEHKIGWTRLWSILMISISGQWDNQVTSTFNALVHTAVICVLVFVFKHYLIGPGIWLIPLIMCLITNSNLAWENTLSCFQVSFYFSQLCAVLFIYYSTKLNSVKNILISSLFAIVGIPTMASNAFPIFATICTSVLFINKSSNKQLSLIRICIFLTFFVISILLYERVEDHKTLRIQSLLDLFDIIPKGFSLFYSKNIFISFIISILINFPIFLFFLQFLFVRIKKNRNNVLILTFSIYTIISILSLLINRFQIADSSRYFDTYFILIFINCICIISLWINFRKNNIWINNFGIWLWFIFIAFILQRSDTHTILAMDHKWQTYEKLLLNYSVSKDTDLLNKGVMSLPYPDKKVIAEVMNHKKMSPLLPTSIRSPIIYRKDIPYSKKEEFFNKALMVNPKFYFLSNETRSILKSDLIYPKKDVSYIRMTYQGSSNLYGRSISLMTEDGRETFLNNNKLRDTGWQTSHFKISDNCKPFYIIVNCKKEEKSWIAFKDLYEVKFTSWLTRQIRKRGEIFSFFGLISILTLIGVKLSKDYSIINRLNKD